MLIIRIQYDTYVNCRCMDDVLPYTRQYMKAWVRIGENANIEL